MAESAIGLLFNDIDLMLEAVASNQDVALVRQAVAHNWLASGQIMWLLNIESASPHAYCIVRHKQALMKPEVRHFMNWLFGLDW